MSKTRYLIGRVTDDTPEWLEYGDSRGYVLIDAETGTFEGWLTHGSARLLKRRDCLGAPIYSEEYDDLRPVRAFASSVAASLAIAQWTNRPGA